MRLNSFLSKLYSGFLTHLHFFYKVAMSLVISAFIVFGQPRHRGSEEIKTGQTVEKAFSLTDVQQLFPEARSYTPLSSSEADVWCGDDKLGKVLVSTPAADSIVGFASSTPLLIGVNPEKRVVGVELLPNQESENFIQWIVGEGLLESWDGCSLDEAIHRNVDAISGATMSSGAIIQTFNYTVQQALGAEVTNDKALTIDYKFILGVLLLILALLQFFFPKTFRPYRLYLQLSTIGILGFWLGTFLSTVSMVNWVTNGIQWGTQLLLILILIVSIALPLFTRKAFYCSYLCPYGAAQDVMGKLSKRRLKLPLKVKKVLSKTRETIFALLIVLLLVGVSFDLTHIEPFSAFLITTASVPVIVLAVTFLLLSIVLPRPWCSYCCPTGQFLELIRRTRPNRKK